MKQLLFILLFQCFAAYAQITGTEVDQGLVHKREFHVGGLLGTNSFGITGRYGTAFTAKTKGMYEADFLFIKHPKEIKSGNPFIDNAKRYVYGKQNTFNNLRLGYGIQKAMFSKDGRKGLEIRSALFLGAAIGIVKPVYLQIGYVESNSGNFPYDYVSTEKYNPDKHFANNIFGRASFTRGLDELSIVPGAYGKFAITFEYSNEYDRVKAIETGIAVDMFTKKIPMMALTDNYRTYIQFYVSFLFGQKYLQ